MNRNDIIEKLIKARKDKGLSQSQLASLIGTKKENISRLESGKQNVSLDLLLKVSSALNKEVSFSIAEFDSNQYYLKQYDNVLLEFELDREKLGDIKANIISINKDYKHLLPLDLEASNEGMVKWLKTRVIPKNRYHVDEILDFFGLEISDTKGIIDICKGLSLNDSYWIVGKEFKGSFKQYNLFENHFNDILSIVAYTGVYSSKRAFTTSPELTTNGMLPKGWRFIDGDGIYLYKGGSIGFSNGGKEPYIEYYASQIAEKMGINHINYDLEKWKNILASKCPLFTDIDTSFIPIGRLVKNGTLNKVIEYYDSLGKEFSNQIRDMLVFDALIMNEDRHLGNFGVLIDNHSGKIIAPAPVFDNGLSLLCYISKGKTTLDETREYANTRLSAYGLSFDAIVKEVITERQKKKLRKMINFKFKRHDKYNLDNELLNNLEIIIQERLLRFLKDQD